MAEEDQKTAAPSQGDSEPESVGSVPATVDQARRFLADEGIRGQSRAKKTEFLKSKGLQDEDIEKLLSEVNETDIHSTLSSASPEKEPEAAPEKVTVGEPTIPKTTSPTPPTASTASDAPPIITYPEFLTHSPRPPPLITPSRVLDILAVSGTAWTLLYGAARFIVSPMVESQTEARSDYYTHVNEKASQMVEKLEGLVSEVPYKNGKPLRSQQAGAYTDAEDDKSSCGDPTEMFHRDIGTQTSPPPSATPSSGSSDANESTVDAQARRLARLRTAVKELSDMNTKRAEDTADLLSGVTRLRDEVDKVHRYPTWTPPASMYGQTSFGRSTSQQEDDEYKKTKDAIRSVKGVFLSSRMFPTAATR
ncbi:uncharacterized protein PG998_009986 [Apiospora kogelbergensis]|uniref:uncharacterized protein n=1 Tax=Apiospora kogelbergensis TaxID=1337665 RepID=UPI00312E1373